MTGQVKMRSSQERGRGVWQWLDVRRRQVGLWAYALNRVTGVGLVVYLYLHLGVLALLAQGPAGWDPFIAVARGPLFLTLDVVLLVGLLLHSLNGLRLTLTGLGLGVRLHKPLFIGLLLVTLVVSVIAAWRIFTA